MDTVQQLRLLYILVIVTAFAFGYRVFRLSPNKPINLFGALTLVFTGFLAMVEHEIALAQSSREVMILDKWHTVTVILLIIMANMTGRLAHTTSKPSRRLLLNIAMALLILSGMAMFYPIIFENEAIIYNFKMLNEIWTYNVRQVGFWAVFYEVWFIAAVIFISLSFFRSYWRSQSVREKQARFIIFLMFSIIPSFLLYEFIIYPDEEVTGSYQVSPLLIICNLGINYFFTDFRLFRIKPASAVDNLLNSLDSLVLILNKSLEIKFFNESFRKEVGANGIQKLIDIHIEDLLKRLRVDMNDIRLSRIPDLKKGQQLKTEIKVLTEKQERFFLVVISPVYNDFNFRTGYVIVCNEMTERIQYEKELQAYNQELEVSNQELERFAYIASHDLKGPLRAINSFINLIDREIQPLQNKKLNKYLRFVSDGTLQMNTLIKEVLEFSTLNKKKELENTNVNLNDTLEQITESLQIKYEQPIKIQFDQMPVLTGNPSLFFQLFFNLIENGLKYNKAALPQVWIKVFETTDYFEFQVKDNGIGIDPKHQQQVFEMFSRLHHQSAFQGTGIGLAICKKVVHLYHGTIRIESELEKGTTVFFTIRK